MPASSSRYDLLRARVRAFTRTLPRAKSDDLSATVRAWHAARRLREVLPVLQLDAPTTEKLDTRLRRVARRLDALRQWTVLRALVDELEQTGRRGRPAAAERVRDDVDRLAERARAELFRRRIGNDVRRVSQKLEAALKTLGPESDDKTRGRAMQWAAKARVARRANNLKHASNAAGSVYLAARLEAVRAAVKKLRYGADLAAEAAGSVTASDVRTLARAHTLLNNLHDIQVLIDRVRYVQGSLATPDVKAWRDLDGFVISLENRCRALHARYIRERTTLVALCDRLTVRASADGTAKRKVS